MSKVKVKEVIIDEVKFFITIDDVEYYVHAYAQDSTENDQYTINIKNNDTGEDLGELYYDSCGNTCEEAVLSDVEVEVLKVLFSDRVHGIIRGF